MRRLLIVLFALVLLLPSVSTAETIVTSFYPVWLLTLNLTEGLDNVTVRNMAAPDTGCLHDYTLQPADMAMLSQADALLINGGGMESFLDLVTSSNPDLPVISAYSDTDILPPSLSDAAEIGESEDGEEINSHFWLDPARASLMADHLAAGLIRIMPEHRDAIEANLESLKSRFAVLENDLKTGLQDMPAQNVIIMHEAFPYYAEACGLHIVAVVNKEPDTDLPVADLAQLVRLVNSYNVKPLIIKSTEPDPSVAALAAETGAPVCELNTLASGPDNPSADYYESVMLENLNALQEILSDY